VQSRASQPASQPQPHPANRARGQQEEREQFEEQEPEKPELGGPNELLFPNEQPQHAQVELPPLAAPNEAPWMQDSQDLGLSGLGLAVGNLRVSQMSHSGPMLIEWSARRREARIPSRQPYQGFQFLEPGRFLLAALVARDVVALAVRVVFR
jgi:hypothetical protein